MFKNGTLIGNCALEEKLYRSGRIGILIGEESARNKGVGTEVINMLVKYGFEELGLHSISLTLNAENMSAYKCYTKAGFNVCGYLHQNIYHHGIWYDTAFMEILSADYFSDKLEKAKKQKNTEEFEPVIK